MQIAHLVEPMGWEYTSIGCGLPVGKPCSARLPAQQSRHLAEGARFGYVGRALSALVAQPDTRTGRQQSFYQCDIALAARNDERRVAEMILSVDVSRCRQQLVGDLDASGCHSQMQ